MSRLEITAAAILFAAGLTGFALFVAGTDAGTPARVAACVMFALLFMPCPVLSVARWAAAARRWVAPAPGLRTALAWILLLAACAGYAALSGTLRLRPAVSLALYGAVPLALLAPRARTGTAFASLPRMALGLAALWLPIELGMLRGLG